MKIIFWHGFSWDDKKFKEMIKKLEDMGCVKKIAEDKQIYWETDMNFQRFVDLWDDKFMAYKVDGDWVIAVTQYGGFGQR